MTRFYLDIKDSKVKKAALGISLTLVLSLALVLIPFSTISAEGVTVSIGAPATAAAGSNFDVFINIGPVTDLTTCTFDLTYNKSLIQVLGLQNQPSGVSNGLLGTVVMPNVWNTYPGGSPGSPVNGNTIRVGGNLSLPNNVTWTGVPPSYVAVVHFRVLDGVVKGSISQLELTNVVLGDSKGNPILLLPVVNGAVTIDEGTAGANVNFSLALQGGSRPDAGWVVPLTVKFFTPGTGAPVDVLTATPGYSFNLTTTKSGSTAIAQATGIIPGTYDISAVSPHCLTNVKRAVTVTVPTTAADMGTLLEGNANDDNKISIQDFGILAVAYGKGTGDIGYDARADFDRSGRINIADFGLLTLNYGKNAPVEVP